VLEFSAGKILQFAWPHPETKQEYSLKILHDPQPCMYPHSLISKGRKIPFSWHATNVRSKATPGTPDFFQHVELYSPMNNLG
jgi:hypothetical protein